MLIELISLIVSYLGVFAGYGLSKIAKEEVSAGERNLLILKRFILIAILIGFFFGTKISLIAIIAFGIIILLGLYLRQDYAALGIVFGLHTDFVMSSLIFLYGFPKGSLLHKEIPLHIFYRTLSYIIFGFIVLLLRLYVL
jgi:hypothetical protein